MKSSWMAALVLAGVVAAGAAWGQTAPGGNATSSRPATTVTSRPSQAAVVADDSRVVLDVPYSTVDEKLNRLDIYAPRKASGAPVLVFVHGGEWSRGDKAAVSSKPKFFNDNGVVFVSVNYRLSPKDKHPAQVDDVAAAVAWVKTHIAEYGGDGTKLVLMGHSAGCHLVTMTALSGTSLAKAGLNPTDLKGVVAWSGGMYDLVDRVKGEGMYPPLIKATFGEEEKGQREASPLTYAKNAKGGPTFLIASTDDEKSKTSREASQKMYDALTSAGGKAQWLILEGKDHFRANHEVGAVGDKTGGELLRFVRGVTGGEGGQR